MAKTKSALHNVLSALQKEESALQTQLGKIQDAISALGSVGAAYRQARRVRKAKTVVRNARTMSAAQRADVSRRMKKYWAERRKAKTSKDSTK